MTGYEASPFSVTDHLLTGSAGSVVHESPLWDASSWCAVAQHCDVVAAGGLSAAAAMDAGVNSASRAAVTRRVDSSVCRLSAIVLPALTSPLRRRFPASLAVLDGPGYRRHLGTKVLLGAWWEQGFDGSYPPSTTRPDETVGDQRQAVTDVLGLNEAHRLDLADLAEEAPAGSYDERVDEKPELVGQVVPDRGSGRSAHRSCGCLLAAAHGGGLSGGRARCPAYWRPCTVSGFSRRRRASSQVIGTPVAVQVTKLEPAIRGRKCFIRCRCGSWPTAADIASWSCQADRVQNVRCSGRAISDRPSTPGEASIWRRIRKAAARNDGTSLSRRSSRREAMTVTGPPAGGGEFGAFQGSVGIGSHPFRECGERGHHAVMVLCSSTLTPTRARTSPSGW